MTLEQAEQLVGYGDSSTLAPDIMLGELSVLCIQPTRMADLTDCHFAGKKTNGQWHTAWPAAYIQCLPMNSQMQDKMTQT